MKQLKFNMEIPKVKGVTAAQKRAWREEQYEMIIHAQNEVYFFTKLEELKRALND